MRARGLPRRARRPHRGRARPRAAPPARCCCGCSARGMCGTDATEWTAGPQTFPVDRRPPGHRPRRPDGPRARVRRRGRRARDRAAAVRGRRRSSPAAPASRAASATAAARAGRTSAVATTRSGSTPPAGWPSTSPCPSRPSSPVPDGLSLDSAGLAQPLAVGLHAARRAGRRDGDRVVLIGAGAIGSFVLAGLRSPGRRRPDRHRLPRRPARAGRPAGRDPDRRRGTGRRRGARRGARDRRVPTS